MLKNVHDKFECVCRVELLYALLEFALLHQFEIKDVVSRANKQVYLGYHNKNDAALSLVISARKQALQHHQR